LYCINVLYQFEWMNEYHLYVIKKMDVFFFDKKKDVTLYKR
jgi:hypothetical protein